jgi:hypothetical protein
VRHPIGVVLDLSPVAVPRRARSHSGASSARALAADSANAIYYARKYLTESCTSGRYRADAGKLLEKLGAPPPMKNLERCRDPFEAWIHDPR